MMICSVSLTRRLYLSDVATRLMEPVLIYLLVPYTTNNSGSINVLFAGRLLRQKGLPSLVDVVQKLRDEGLNVNLLVAGIFDPADPDSISPSELQSWESLGFFKWLGTRSDMNQVINLSDIVCLPTKYAEGIPRILIESAACCKPLLAPDVPGCNEIIRNEENGLLYCHDQSPSFIDCLRRLVLSDSLRSRMGVRGRQLVEANYTDKTIISQLFALYSSILDQ